MWELPFMLTYESMSSEETENLGKKIASFVKAGDNVCLSGDLGCGKTIFAKGFAKGLGISETITSPTFILMNVYEQETGLTLYHFDVYRLNSPDEIYDVGYEDYFYGQGVCLIEWAELIESLIPKNAIWVCIEKRPEKGQDYRLITVKNFELPS